MRFAFVLNPAARSGRAARDADRVLAGARALGLDASLHLTAQPGHATDLARGFAGAHDVVVAVGGDGTAQEVATGLLGTDAALGVLPLGTGNDLAHALGMPTRLPAALRALASGAKRPMDMGRVRWVKPGGEAQERYFANSVGVGFDALVASQVPRYKRLGGRAAYLAATVGSLGLWRRRDIAAEVRLHPSPEAAEVLYEGAFFLCEVGNGPSVGGGVLLTPQAALDNGALDLCLARAVGPLRIARLLPLAVRGMHTAAPEVVMGRAPRITIRATRGALPVHADGEPVSPDAERVEVEVLPGAVQALWGPGSDR